MLSESEIDKLTREVVAGAEEEFVAQLTAALVDDYVHGVEKGASSRWRMEELARANREHVDTILRQFQNTAISEAANLVLAALMEADERSARMIANYQGKEVRAATRQSALMAKQTARGVGEIVRRQNIDLAAQAERKWYEVTAQTLALSNRGALPRGHYERAIIELGRAGVSKVNYRSGVSNQIDVAIKRHIRTQVNQAAGHMEIERLNDTGHNLVITSAHFGARPEHAVWQGKAFSMSGRQVVNGVVYEDFYQQTGYGTVTGLCGANCRHHFGVYIPGMALPELPETINGMDSDEYYAATQRQRELERRVRKTKRDIAALEQAGVGLDSPTYVQKRLVLGNQQKQLRQLCTSKGLKRESYREKAYGIGKQPVALRSTYRERAGDMPQCARFAKASTKSREARRKALEKRCHNCLMPIFDDGYLGRIARAAGGRIYKKGVYRVVAHGSSKTMSPFSQRTDAKTMAQIIRNRKDYNGEPVELFSCSTGRADKKGNCFAQRLANELNTTVTAPNDTIWLFGDGHYTIGKTEEDNTGKMITFYPRRRHDSS